MAKGLPRSLANSAIFKMVASIVGLTGSSGGTADGALVNIPAATAASTDNSAASLASTNAALTAVRNDIADLQEKLNELIAALKP